MSAVAPTVSESGRWLLLRSIVLLLLVVCTYLQVPLMSGDRLIVPSFPTIALIPFVFLLVHKDITGADYLFLAKVAFVLLLSIGLSPGYRYVDEKLLSLVQCVMAIGVAILAVRLMHQVGSEALERTLLTLWLLIMVGVLLEQAGIIKDASDRFREWAFSAQYTVYDHDLRDEGLVGWSRPKLFSVEPSHVTKFFVASLNAWLMVRVTWRKVAVGTAATLIMLIVMGSPMLLVSAAMTALTVMWDRRTTVGARATMICAAFILAVGVSVFHEGETFSTIGARIASISESGETVSARPSSEQQRVVIPYLTLVNTWLQSPLFGVGIGGKEVVAEQSQLRLDRPAVALGNNALAESGVYLGLVGSIWLIAIMWRQFGHSGVTRVGMLMMLIGLFSQLMGGVVSFQYWGFIGLLWGALAVSDRQTSSAAVPETQGAKRA